MTHQLPFIDLQAQRQRLGDDLDTAIARVLEHGQFIMGPEVRALEAALAEFADVAEVVTCSSGTDALVMPLMARGVGPGDAVFVPAFTFVASAEAVALLGATPVFVDVAEASFNMDPQSLDDAIGSAREAGLRPACIMPVDLFGQPADYPSLSAIAAREGCWLLGDAAQSFGGSAGKARVGSLAQVTATSFFPAKPLGCYGDGGAILTDDADLAEVLRSIRVHGQGSHKYDTIRLGLNGRLDTMQAAILLEKLKLLDEEIEARERIAARYSHALADRVTVPSTPAQVQSAWAQYTIRHPARDRIAAELRGQGIPTALYYPAPLNRQLPYRDFPTAPGGLPVSEALAQSVLSLPLHPYLGAADQDRIIDGVRRAAAGHGRGEAANG